MLCSSSLQIDRLSFSSPFVLAPLAGYTDLPFRLLCRSFGAGYCVSEMISCHGLIYKQKKTLQMLASIEEERPVAFQLFGADPDIMEEAAIIMASYKPDIIDINMGCPVRKVTKRGAGAALMTTPDLAKEIISRITRAVSLPVTVKIRSGKDKNNLNCVEIARIAEDCGASCVTVHARTWTQGFGGHIDPEMIKKVKDALSIPVIGNGDILSIQDGFRLMELTNCNGVMIGRGALGNPWIFSGKSRPQSLPLITEVALRHLALMEEYLAAERMLGYIRNQICRYYKGLPGCSKIRQKIFAVSSLAQLQQLLHSIS